MRQHASGKAMCSACSDSQDATLEAGEMWGCACVLLIMLFGNHLEYTQLLSGEHMSSSQRFFPRLSRIGLDEKSISQVSDVGAAALDASVSKSIVDAVFVLVDGPTSAAATSALHMSFGHRGCPVGLVRPNAPCRQWCLDGLPALDKGTSAAMHGILQLATCCIIVFGGSNIVASASHSCRYEFPALSISTNTALRNGTLSEKRSRHEDGRKP